MNDTRNQTAEQPHKSKNSGTNTGQSTVMNDTQVPQLELDRLTKRYGQSDDAIVAVEDLNIELREGEFLVLVGPSGCGKSTTLHCIAGLEDITDGDLRIDGERVNEQRPEERNIAMVFQNYALYPHMTSRQNIGFGLKMTTNLGTDEINQRVEEVAEMLGISELLDDKPKELSGGQQQRVALGRAIVREPRVFLMDEPLSNLDAKLRTQMRTEIQTLQQNLDVTTVYVTHDQTEAMTMGDRIAVLNGGQLQQIGTPLECYHRPANRFVAGFIGEPSMNFFETTREDQRLLHQAFKFPLDEAMQAKLGNTAEITLGIRPEDIEIADDGSGMASATVTVVEPTGDRTYLHLDVEGQTITATVDEGIVSEGSEIQLSFPPDAVHMFDTNTGKALYHRQGAANLEELPDQFTSQVQEVNEA